MQISAVLEERVRRYETMRKDREVGGAVLAHYRNSPADFITDWVMTYDPRLPQKIVPFTLFERQREFINWLDERRKKQGDGLVEKSRDMGVTWLACAYSIWLWLFFPDVKISWASRKEDYVDRLGDPDSIFEKLRQCVRYLPALFQPPSYIESAHATFKRIINPDNGSVISGEAGDNIGRGGRSTIYFKDESAFFEHAEKIEAALSSNSSCIIDISTANGMNNPFYQKRAAGKIPVFTFHWRDDPRKNQAWYDEITARLPAHIVAQEIDIDYRASVSGALIVPAWVDATVDADRRLKFDSGGEVVLGYDVADGGGDKNAIVIRRGSAIVHAEHWHTKGDAVDNAARVAAAAYKYGATKIIYDSVGVGAAARTALNRRDDLKAMRILPYNGGDAVVGAGSFYVPGKRNGEMFLNLKAQSYWLLRDAFENTFKATKGIEHDAEKLISISRTLPLLNELRNELTQVSFGNNLAGKITIDKKPNGAPSPNLADALVMAFSRRPELRLMVI